MTFRVLSCAALVVATLLQPAKADEPVGTSHFLALSRERGADLNVTVWYPAQAGGEAVTLGDSMLFVGTQAMRDAPIAAGRYPLILLSHGAGLAGTPEALSWIATPLAGQGFIVAAPTHPGNGGPNRSAAETMKLWLRPSDLSHALDTIESQPLFKDHLDGARVGMLGLSMGGNTALAIAGARLDAKRLAAYCDTDAINASLCEWVRMSGVDLHAIDMRDAERDNSDPRIRFAMAIDPAPSDVFDAASFAGISIPVDIVNLGRRGKIPATADASGIAKAIPHARYDTIEDASHYSMFGECKPGAAALVISQQIGDPVCDDGGGRPRGDIHRQLVGMAVRAFDRALRP